LNHVDHNRSKDEEKVDQNPEGQGCYPFSNLKKNDFDLLFFAKDDKFTSGEEFIVETSRAVRERNKVTKSPILPGTI